MASDGDRHLDRHPSNMHTMVLGGCTKYFQWLSMGMYYSHEKSGQPGPITRILCCSDEERDSVPQSWLDLGPTYIAKSMAKNPHNNDAYGAYNKPYAVIDFLENSPPKEDWLIIIDADMVMRLPFLCKGESFDNGEDASLEMNCERGRPISAFYGYLKGTNNDLATRHIPQVPIRNNTDGGQPLHRRSDQVGGFVVVHRDDMLQYMHDWLKMTEDVRDDPEAWHLTGDVYSTKPGVKPWISEMYGYSFAAAKHSMWHQTDQLSMLYPSYMPNTAPRVLHYGLDFSIETNSEPFSFNKHDFHNFDPLACSLTQDGKDGMGLLPMPPSLQELTSAKAGPERLRDLLSIEAILTLNEAFCQHHRLHCNANDSQDTAALLAQCDAVNTAAEALREALWRVGSVESPAEAALCQDSHGLPECTPWVKAGECNASPGFMAGACLKSCGMCMPVLPRTQVSALHEAKMQSQPEKETSQPVPADDISAHGMDTDADLVKALGTHEAISSLQLHTPKQDTIIDGDTTAFAHQHEREFPGTADAQLRGISSQTAAEQTTEHQRAARLGDVHDLDGSNDLRSRQVVTSVQPQVGDSGVHLYPQINVRESDALIANTQASLPVVYSVASLSLWLLVVATVLALGSATRRQRMRRSAMTRNQYPDIGEFL